MPDNDPDIRIRLAAVEHLKRASVADIVTADDLTQGFLLDGQRFPFINPQRGIFIPAAMRYLLSVRTVFPASGRRYAFMGTDPAAADNRWLREAMEAQIPIIYLLGVAPQRYTPIWPAYIADWSASDLKARLAFAPPTSAEVDDGVPTASERRYGLRLVRQRLHQATFREAVLTAYGSRCAVSGLPEPRLLDAAHIIVDSNEELGQPVVTNGLPLSKIHHAAFDANLIGIDPDFRIHVADQLLAMHDGPMLEQGLKALAGRIIRLPHRRADHPDRDPLAQRFSQFQLNT